MMIMWLDSSSSIDRISRFDGDLIDLEQILLLIARSDLVQPSGAGA